MYQRALESIIGRAAMDSQFRQRMAEEPEIAFEEYELTPEQLSALKTISMDALERFARQVTESFGNGLVEI